MHKDAFQAVRTLTERLFFPLPSPGKGVFGPVVGKGDLPSYYWAIYIHIIHGTEMTMAAFGDMNLGATTLATSLCVRADTQQFPEGNSDLGHGS